MLICVLFFWPVLYGGTKGVRNFNGDPFFTAFRVKKGRAMKILPSFSI